MSYSTIYQAANDLNLQARVDAAVNKEAFNNPTYGDTPFGANVKTGNASVWQTFRYPVAVGVEAEYEFAINDGNPDPGGDPAVIPDSEILSIIQASWPMP